MKKSLWLLLGVLVYGVVCFGQPVTVPQFKREIAGVSADMRTLQDDQRLMLQRIMALEQDNAANKALVKELQETITFYEQRLQELDKRLRESEERLHGMLVKGLDTVQKGQQKEQDEFRLLISKELNRVEQIAVKAENTARTRPVAAPQPPPPRTVRAGAYIEYVVMPGDNLTVLAQANKISVRALMDYNNLKSEKIRSGQKLKIPVVQ